MNVSDDKFPGQDATVLRLVDGLAWGSLWDEIPDFEQTLQALLYAAGALAPPDTWEADFESERGYSFDQTHDDIDVLPDDELRALITDLVNWLFIFYTNTGIATLVRGLNDLLNTGAVFERAHHDRRP